MNKSRVGEYKLIFLAKILQNFLTVILIHCQPELEAPKQIKRLPGGYL